MRKIGVLRTFRPGTHGPTDRPRSVRLPERVWRKKLPDFKSIRQDARRSKLLKTKIGSFFCHTHSGCLTELDLYDSQFVRGQP
jgi:hypothetical protein